MRKRLFTLLLTLVLIVTCVTPITASAAWITQEYAVTNLLRWTKFTQADADAVGGWVKLAYAVGLVLDTDNFVPDVPCTTAYYNTLRKRANHPFRQNSAFVKIDTQPQSGSVELGVDMMLIAEASISNGTDTAYQWYSCADANKTAATAIRGATYNTLTVAPKETGVFYYFCRFSAKTTEDVQPLDSDVVCVTVTKAYITVVTQPEDLNPDRGGEATLTASASSTNGRKVSYQWYSCTDKLKTDATPIEGATDAVFHAPTDMYGDYYYFCRFSANNLECVDSDVVCVDVPFMIYENGLAQPILKYTDASVETYTNEGSDIVRFCVYVETDYDTDGDGKLDLVKAVVQLPRAAMYELYKNLAESARQDNMRAVAKKTLNITLKRSKLPKAEIARRANVAASTITAVTRGDPVRLSTAEAIAEALGSDLKSLFTITNDSTPLSNKTILEHHRLISTILSQADKELLIPFNPAAKATPPKVQKSSPDYYQPEEMDLILDALENAPIRWKAITYLLIDTGCRRGEIMGLKWSKVDLDTGLIIIDCALLYTESKGIYEGPTKTNDFRAMKLAPQSLAVLKEWQKEYENLKELNGDRWEDSPYVFVRDNGAPLHPDSITRWQSNFSKKHDIPPIHPHAFRHTAASTMIANGVDIVTTATELGHASPTTTANMYAHQIAVARAKAADVRAGVFANRK